MKNGKNNFGFSYRYIKYGKFWSVSLESFHRAQSLKLWGVFLPYHKSSQQLFYAVPKSRLENASSDQNFQTIESDNNVMVNYSCQIYTEKLFKF